MPTMVNRKSQRCSRRLPRNCRRSSRSANPTAERQSDRLSGLERHMYRSVILIVALLTMNTSARSEEVPTANSPQEYKGSSSRHSPRPRLVLRPIVPTGVKRFAKTPASNGQTDSPISNTRMTTAYKSVPSNQYSAVEAPSARLGIAQRRLLAPLRHAGEH
jgi:hypothetical protein